MPLAIERKVGERVFIGDDIEIAVVLISKDKVRLGISAPRSLAIRRDDMKAGSPSSQPGGAK